MTTTTALTPQRLAVRFALREPVEDLDPAIAVFHRCLQRGWLEGQLIDVADYRHVPAGPGVMIVGHDVDLSLTPDALTLTRKRQGAPVEEQARDLVRMAAVAQEAWAYDGTLQVELDLGGASVQLLDRALATELGADAARLLADAVAPAFRAALGEDVSTAPVTDAADPRHVPAATATAGGAPTAGEVLERLGGSQAPDQSPFDITVERFVELRGRDDVTVVDVREDSEREIVHLGGVPIPLGTLADRLDELDRDSTVVVHCRAGVRGATAVQLLREHGFTDAWNVNGGLVAWADRIDPTTPRY